jgi:hypothetical protein
MESRRGFMKKIFGGAAIVAAGFGAEKVREAMLNTENARLSLEDEKFHVSIDPETKALIQTLGSRGSSVAEIENVAKVNFDNKAQQWFK